MSKRFASFQRDLKRLSKQLNSEKGLMLKKTFDTTASLYGKGKENKPYVTLNVKGDFKISILKLTVILIFILSTLALIMFCIRNFIWHYSIKKARGTKKISKKLEEDWD
jgi:hypothetical protein